MSYDIWLEADTGGPERATVDDNCPGNITYNVDAIFARALDDPEAGVRDGLDVVLRRKDPALKRFDGRAAGECVGELAAAVERMEEDPASFRELNPVNGWGDFDGALEYMRAFRDHCRDHPRAIVAMWL